MAISYYIRADGTDATLGNWVLTGQIKDALFAGNLTVTATDGTVTVEPVAGTFAANILNATTTAATVYSQALTGTLDATAGTFTVTANALTRIADGQTATDTPTGVGVENTTKWLTPDISEAIAQAESTAPTINGVSIDDCLAMYNLLRGIRLQLIMGAKEIRTEFAERNGSSQSVYYTAANLASLETEIATYKACAIADGAVITDTPRTQFPIRGGYARRPC